MDIPSANSHCKYEKVGYLHKQYGRTFPYLNQWRKRYCVLTDNYLFLYEKDTSKGNEKTNHIVDLKYFNQIFESGTKDGKKHAHLFTISSEEPQFKNFDQGRHVFAADTATEMKEWVKKISQSVDRIQNNKRKSEPVEKNTKNTENVDKKSKKNLENAEGNKKNNNKSEQFSEKLKMEQKSIENNNDIKNVEVEHFEKEIDKDNNSPKNHSDLLTEECESESLLRKSERKTPHSEYSDLGLVSQPQLDCVTKNRIKGPAGRRAPQTRLTVLLKQRASSLTSLQPNSESLNIKSTLRSESTIFENETQEPDPENPEHNVVVPESELINSSINQSNDSCILESYISNNDISRSNSSSSSVSNSCVERPNISADHPSLSQDAEPNPCTITNTETADVNVDFDEGIDQALFFTSKPSINEPETNLKENKDFSKKDKISDTSQTRNKREPNKSFSYRCLTLYRSITKRERPKNSLTRNPTFKFFMFRSDEAPTSGHPDERIKSSHRCLIL